MIAFYHDYAIQPEILPQPVAKLETAVESTIIITKTLCPRIVQDLLTQIPWGHNILLMEKFKDLPIRLWYAQQVIVNGWSRDVLTSMIKNRTHERQEPIGVADYEFTRALPQELASSLPSIEQIETELQQELRGDADER
jgi:hypothetical protein